MKYIIKPINSTLRVKAWVDRRCIWPHNPHLVASVGRVLGFHMGGHKFKPCQSRPYMQGLKITEEKVLP